MQRVVAKTFLRPARRFWLGMMAVTVTAVLFTGCTPPVGKAVVDTPSQETSVPVQTEVKHLSDGRTGFVITEPVPAEPEIRRLFDQANALMQEPDQQGRAIELFERLVMLSPGLTAPHINVSMLYRETDQSEIAEEHLKAALELVPGHPVASNEYGLLLREAGRFPEARRIYETALKRFPEYLPLRKNLGILCDLYLGDTACALNQYELYSEARPEDEKIKIWIADLRLRTKID